MYLSELSSEAAVSPRGKWSFVKCQPLISLFCRSEFVGEGMGHNVGACDGRGLGGLGNEAKRNAKTDQLRLVPRHNVNKETESYADTEPGHCTSTVLAPVVFSSAGR